MAEDPPPATSGKASNPPINSKLVVSNLHYEITPKDLAVRLHPDTIFAQLVEGTSPLCSFRSQFLGKLAHLFVSHLSGYEPEPSEFFCTEKFRLLGSFIKYDRSGRSSGVAIISYETNMEATKAKSQFDGVLAKGDSLS
jgi:hypothetical protein